MIILIHPVRANMLSRDFQELSDLGIPDATQVIIDQYLPLEDKNGNPILFFKVDLPTPWSEAFVAEPVLKE